jgi:2-polyprenyl-6-hydroxyphenyl methylase / 3-demethylubiquinone-9 3-methyltransferase
MGLNGYTCGVTNIHADNGDPAEIAKFDQLAHGFWDANGPFRPLHRLNPVRVDFIAAHAAISTARVVDVGCGGGLLAEALAARGAAVTAIDLSPAMIATARLHAAESGLSIDYRLMDAAALAQQSAHRFDVVCCLEMLEHVPDPAAMVGILSDLLTPTGTVFVSTINRNAKAFISAIVGAEYMLRLLPRGTHEYSRFIRPAELATWARASGLSLHAAAGLAYEPFSERCRLSDDVSVNYIAALSRRESNP